VAGHPLTALGTAVIAAFAVWARRWFVPRLDAAVDARDSGDADAVRRLRALHWGGMLCHAIPLVAVLASIPRVFVGLN